MFSRTKHEEPLARSQHAQIAPSDVLDRCRIFTQETSNLTQGCVLPTQRVDLSLKTSAVRASLERRYNACVARDDLCQQDQSHKPDRVCATPDPATFYVGYWRFDHHLFLPSLLAM